MILLWVMYDVTPAVGTAEQKREAETKNEARNYDEPHPHSCTQEL